MTYIRTLALLFAVMIFATGCKNDDNNEETPSESEEWTEADEAQARPYEAAALLLSNLTGQDLSAEDVMNLNGKTYEAQYGETLDEGDPLEQTLFVKSAEMAEAYFCSLAGGYEEYLHEVAGGYRIDLSSVGAGTLEFTRDGDGSNVGYAIVTIPCLPHLQRIIYKTEEQRDVNDGPTFDSPCKYGEVYLHEGRYYICVKESTGYSSAAQGYLVCMEAGKGTNWELYLSKESWGCWKPKQNWTNSKYIVDYLYLCADPAFSRQKQRIVKAYPGKVFPYCQRWSDYDEYAQVGDATWGFGCKEPGYSHVTRFEAEFANEKSNCDKEKKEWKGLRAVVIRDATEGNYRASKAKWWRRCHHYVLPWICKYDKGIYADTHKYTSKGGWQDFFDDKPIVYTMNVKTFNDVAPSGYALVDI